MSRFTRRWCGSITAANKFVPVPIDLGPAGEQVFLILYGTGIRGSSVVTVQLGGVDVTPQYAGEQGQFPGLDQVNLPIPRSLAGKGLITLVLTADGSVSNTLRAQIK